MGKSIGRIEITLSLEQANTSVVYDLKGIIAFQQGNLESASTYFRKALRLDPNNAMAWSNYSAIKQNYENNQEAKQLLERAILIDPNLSIAYFDRASVNIALGNLEQAIEDYSKVIEQHNNLLIPAYFNRALSYKKMGFFTSAINDLNEVIALVPDHAVAWKIRGNINLLSGFYNKAVSDFTRAIEFDNELAEAYFNRGIAHLLNYNVMPACMDFGQSFAKGYERGEEKQLYFCGN